MNLKHDIEDKNRFKFFTIIRVSIFISLIIVFIITLTFADSKIRLVPIIFLIFTATLIGFLNFLFLKLYSLRTSVYVQLISDIFFVTVLVYISGGINSPFYFLYILPIFISAVFLKRRDTIITASVSFVFFGMISEMMYIEIIPTNIENYQNSISISIFIYNLTMSFIAFLSIAIISSFYFSKMKTTDKELRLIKSNLEDLALLNHTVIDKMEHGFVTSDYTGKIISFNKKAQALIQFNSSDNIFKLLDIKSEDMVINRVTNNSRHFSIERKLNSRTLNFSISFVSNISEFKLIIVFLISDLTNKIEIENILKEKEHLALIGEMAAGIAHEIRNPLASISGSVQFLKNDINLKEEHKNLMDIIIKESDRLSNSIEEFLDFTKCTPLNKTKFNLSKLIDDTLTLINTNNKNIKFVKKYNNEVLILADEKKIQQVVWNLLSNSIKAVKGNGIIEITIIKGKKTAMYIKDDGIGIDKVELKKIFLPFYSKFTSGIGLGMAIVKRILNEHEAKIKIISKKNLGTEIKIIFGDIDEHN